MSFVRLFKRRLAPRRFHAFVAGPGKTGTVSFATMFARHYRSAHEPRADELIGLLTADMTDVTRRAALRAFVAEQDREGLEMNSSHLNTWVIDLLVDAFPDAKFIVAMRDCVTWTNSVINQLLNRPNPGEHFLNWRVAEFGDLNRMVFAPEEAALRRRGIWPLSRYLHLWRLSYQTVFEAVPESRLLVLRTRDISESRPLLADFLGIRAHTIDLGRSHAHKAIRDHGVLAEMDQSFVEESLEDICGRLMRRWFPDEPLRVAHHLGRSETRGG